VLEPLGRPVSSPVIRRRRARWPGTQGRCKRGLGSLRPSKNIVNRIIRRTQRRLCRRITHGWDVIEGAFTWNVIGQAKGILMTHFEVDSTRAFEMLKSVSQNENTPLRSVAEQIVDRF